MSGILRSLSKRFKSKNSGSTTQYDPKTQLLCKVILLDNSDMTIVLDKKALGQDACNKVYVHLDLEETDYFGLTFMDHDNIQHWLDPVKKIKKQIPKGRCATFRFQVKFFSSEPSNLRGEFTRYLFFLQLKSDIKSGKLPCSKESAILLAALQLQSEFGDYNPVEHNEAFVSEFRFYTAQDEQMEIEILKKYKTLVGTAPIEAETQYLEHAKMLRFYGVDLNEVVAKDNNNYRLGLTPTGVVVFDKENLVGVLFWQFIQAVNFSNRKLTIILDEHSSNEIQQHTFVFSLVSNRACKRMWKRAIEFHTFYRMRSHRPAKRSATEQFFRLSSSYQHRGRTEFENVNCPMRRERSVVKFERKPSQRYGPRQSHVLRLRQMTGQPANNTSVKQEESFSDSIQIENSSILFNNSSVSQQNSTFAEPNEINSSTIAANRTYIVSPAKMNLNDSTDSSTISGKTEQLNFPNNLSSTVIDGKNITTTAQIHPITQNGVRFGSVSDTNVTKPNSRQENEKSISASAIPVHSKIPRFGKQKPNIAGPRLYEEPADLPDETNENSNSMITSNCSGELKAPSKSTKITCIPKIQSSQINKPKMITQL